MYIFCDRLSMPLYTRNLDILTNRSSWLTDIHNGKVSLIPSDKKIYYVTETSVFYVIIKFFVGWNEACLSIKKPGCFAYGACPYTGNLGISCTIFMVLFYNHMLSVFPLVGMVDWHTYIVIDLHLLFIKIVACLCVFACCPDWSLNIASFNESISRNIAGVKMSNLFCMCPKWQLTTIVHV